MWSNEKIILTIIVTIILTAAITLSISNAYILNGSLVTYDKKNAILESENISGALNELSLIVNKKKDDIITALNNKGITTSQSSGYEDIINNINSLPIIFIQNEDGTYNYQIDGDDEIKSFNNQVNLSKVEYHQGSESGISFTPSSSGTCMIAGAFYLANAECSVAWPSSVSGMSDTKVFKYDSGSGHNTFYGVYVGRVTAGKTVSVKVSGSGSKLGGTSAFIIPD